MMATVNDVVNFYRTHQWGYSEAGNRLDPPNNGNKTDCSGSIIYAYKQVLGLDIGTYTGTMIAKGTEVTGTPQPGDCVFFDWGSNGQTSTFDHVALSTGGDGLLSHGGPGEGPVVRSLAQERVSAIRVMVRRYAEASASASVNASANVNAAASAVAKEAAKAAHPAGSALVVDGVCGPATITRWQQVMGTVADGVISGQVLPDNKTYGRPALNPPSITYGGAGSQLVRAVQKQLGCEQDGLMGPITIRAIQAHLGVAQDAFFGPDTVRALQTRLNQNKF
jgi:peptidoglycan hydrolase-like protein with peptidoglycan-binding domain